MKNPKNVVKALIGASVLTAVLGTEAHAVAVVAAHPVVIARPAIVAPRVSAPAARATATPAHETVTPRAVVTPVIIPQSRSSCREDDKRAGKCK